MASGVGQKGMTLINFPEADARFLKVVQTGSKSNYWSIHELYSFGTVNIDSVRLDKKSLVLDENPYDSLKAIVFPAKAELTPLKWWSSNPAIATVNADGAVKAVAEGIAYIYVGTIDGIKMDSSEVVVHAFGTPVRMSGLKATQVAGNKMKVLVTWKSYDEVNVDHYEIQQSINGKDFKTVGSLKAESSTTYFYNDKLNAPASKLYYRIKALDKDNRVSWSNVFALEIKVSNLQSTFIYPNPLKDTFYNIVFSAMKNATQFNIQLFDLSGRQLDVQKLNAMAGVLVYNMQLDQILEKGIYILKITNEKTGQSCNQKLIIN